MSMYKRELDAITASEEYKAQLAGAMKRTQAQPRKRSAKKGSGAAVRWLAPIAAVLLIAVILFSIPSVSRAVSDWFIGLFRLEDYLEAGHDDADVNPDIEQAITHIDQYGQSYEILLLDEIPATEYYDFESINHGRVGQGQKPFDRADWEWLLALRPEVREVLYDGKNLFFTTFYGCEDPTPFARGYIELHGLNDAVAADALSLDILTLDITVWVNGVEQTRYGDSSSLDFSKWYERAKEPDFTLDEIKADGGVYGMTELFLPVSPALPDGLCEVELVQTVQDNRVDNMNSIGMVAEIIHRFSFDTTAGNASVNETALDTVALSGVTPYTVTYWGEPNTEERGRIITETVDLNGITITPLVSKRSTGIHIQLRFSYPDDPAYSNEWLCRTIEKETNYDLYIDGALIDRLDALGSPDAPTVEIPLTPSELAKIRSIVLKPVVTYYTVIAGRDMMAEGAEILLPLSGGFAYDPAEQAEVHLTGCDISIPLS